MTRVALTIVLQGAPGPLDAQLRFHLAAGVDALLVSDPLEAGELHDALATYRAADALHVVSAGDVAPRRRLAEVAMSEHGADWVIDVADGEFWWPRGESFQDVLSPIPPRYGIVQGLVRRFASLPDDGTQFWERMTVRRSLLEIPPGPGGKASVMLRPAYRAHPGLDPGAPGGGPGTRQPLRAWYPFEVLTFALGGPDVDEEVVRRGLEDGSLVLDERLRDTLAALESGQEPPFRVPDVVDDAAYAGECAAVGEVDLELLDRQIRELESRIVELEARFWPRVQRFAARVVRRSSR